MKELIVRGIIVNNGSVLLCKVVKSGFYFLPGGHIEEGENPETALERELVEEFDTKPTRINFVEEVENSYLEEEKVIEEKFYVFVVTLENYENIKSREDHIDFEWVKIEDFKSVDFRPKKITGEILEIIKKEKDFWI
ncbi:MAG: NUDIX domain-containing protein [bacterium]